MDRSQLKRTAVLTVLAILALVHGALAATTPHKPAPDVEVRPRVDAFLATWNQHDSKAMAAFWASDGDLINMYGRVAMGPEAIADNLAGEHATDMRLAMMTTSALAIRMIGPAIALADWDVDLTGVLNPDASAAPSVKEHWTIVMHKKNGVWWFVAARVASFFATPPVVR